MSKEEATFGEIEREYAYLNKILEELVSADVNKT